MRFSGILFSRRITRRSWTKLGAKNKPQNNLDLRIDSISSGENEIIANAIKQNKNVHHGSELTTFESLNLRTDVIQGLENLKIAQPTIIQMLSIPHVMQRKNIFCAAQTGSGKTLVYVAPIIHRIKEDDEAGYVRRLSRPRALVVAPARELAEQILQIFKSFKDSAPIRSLGLIGQQQKKWKRDYLKGVVDVVVGTPSTLLKYHEKGLLSLADLQYLVLDEADTLFDENFSEITEDLLDICHFGDKTLTPTKPPVQCILTSATLPPKGVLSGYKQHIPNLEVCQSNLHKVLPNVKHTFIKTTQEDKYGSLLSLITKELHRKNGGKCIIFCNTSKSCNWVSYKLNEDKIVHSKLHGNMNPRIRFGDFEKFMYKDNRVLVATDIASRGLDTNDVTLVLNFDCPFNTTDYIHRSGRTGRATQLHDGNSEVVTYITQNKEVLFARKIQDAAKKNESLDDIKSKTNSPKDRYKKQLEDYERLRKTNKHITSPRRHDDVII